METKWDVLNVAWEAITTSLAKSTNPVILSLERMDDWVTGCRCEIFKLASVWGAVRHQVMWWAGVISLGPSEPPTPALGAHWNHSGPDNVWLLALRSLSTPHLWLLLLLTSCAAQASRILKTPPGDSKMQPRVRINTGGPLGNHTAFFFSTYKLSQIDTSPFCRLQWNHMGWFLVGLELQW